MQQPPPGYAVPPNGGPRPSMPPTPIPSHAHPYYQQSPQCAYLARVTLLLMLTCSSSATCCPVPDDDASPRTASLRPLAGPACTNGWCWPCLSLSCLTGHCARPYCLPRCSLLLTMWRSLCDASEAWSCVYYRSAPVLSSGCHVMLFAAICCDAIQNRQKAQYACRV